MKKIIIVVMPICIVAAILAAQPSSTAPVGEEGKQTASQPESQPSTSQPALPRSFVTTPTTNPNAKYNFTMQYRPGQKYEMTYRYKYVYSRGGNPNQKASVDTMIKYYVDVMPAASDGGVDLKMTMAHMIVICKASDGKEVTIDTDKPKVFGDDKLEKAFSAMLWNEYTVHLDNDGSIGKVGGVDEYIQKICSNVDPEKLAITKARIDALTKDMELQVGSLVSMPTLYVKCRFNDMFDSCGLSVVNVPHVAVPLSLVGSNEQSTMSLVAINDSPSGKIAIVNVDGVIGENYNKASRGGQIRFNLDTNMVERIVLFARDRIGPMEASLDIKTVDQIPTQVEWSKNAANPPATSRPTTTTNPNARYKIAMKYQPGKKYEIVIRDNKMCSYIRGPDGPRSYDNWIFEILCYLDVGNADSDGNVAAKITVGRIVGTNISNDNKKCFDTDKPETIGDDRASKTMAAIKESKFLVHFDKAGSIKKIDGTEKLNACTTMPATQPIRNTIAERVAKSLISIPIAYANCQFDNVGDSCDFALADMPVFAAIDDGCEEKSVMKLISISDSPGGRIAVVDISGVLNSGRLDAVRTGCMRFNLDTKLADDIKLETLKERDGSVESIEKVGVTVKLVDEIPVSTATSKPAS